MKKSIVTLLISAAFLASSPVWAEDTTAATSTSDSSAVKHKCKIHENCDMPCGESSDNIFKKSGRGIKKGAVKVKNGFVWTGHKIKGVFTRD